MNELINEIENAITEVQQPRSRFQLERFVLGQHATQEMRYYQTLLELQDMIFKYKHAKLDVQELEARIEKLRAKGDPVSEIKAQKKELALKQTQLALIGAERELNHLIEIYQSFDHKFTRAEIESAQPDYWRERLTGTAKAMLMGGSGVGHAQIEAMEQAGVLDSFVQEVEQAKKELSS